MASVDNDTVKHTAHKVSYVVNQGTLLFYFRWSVDHSWRSRGESGAERVGGNAGRGERVGRQGGRGGTMLCQRKLFSWYLAAARSGERATYAAGI